MAAFGPDFKLPPFSVLYHKQPLLALKPSLALLVEVLIFIGFAVFYFIMQELLGGGAAYLIFGEFTERTLMPGVLLGTLPAALLTVALIWLVLSRLGKNPAEYLNLRWPRLGWLGWVLVVGNFCFLMFAIMLVMAQIVKPQEDGVKEAMLALSSSPQLYFFAVLSAMIGAPLVEEFLFRGYLFAVLANSRLGFSGSIVATSALWAMVHGQTASFSLVAIIFVMGLILGYFLVRFGSLWVVLACHSLWNLIVSSLIFAAGSTS